MVERVAATLDLIDERRSCGTRTQHILYPGRLSAKEAFSKAIGLGLRMPMTWRSCEILNAASGKPGKFITYNPVIPGTDWSITP